MAAVVLARFKVQDYDRWREVFVSKADLRKENGCNGTHIFVNAADKNDVTVNFQWESAEQALAFFEGDAARAAMREAGVIGQPDHWVVEDGGRTPN
ncbi:MAG TPA: antibiotic biosynthesis monooxygenase [Dehalococcoidia bacterium]|jgi:heme-degrading monooxygenase HmoA|nr:antibiotic biosynthesis monooxygenase [Dehalococcoidia bacterium]